MNLSSYTLLLAAILSMTLFSVQAQAPLDPVEQIEAKRRELLIKQVIEKGRLLKDLHRGATASADLAAVNAIQAMLEETTQRYQSLQSPATTSDVSTAAEPDFYAQLQGRKWITKGSRVDYHTSFNDKEVIFDYTDGKTFKYNTQLVWPGLIRYQHPSGQISFIVFDSPSEAGYHIMFASEYFGKLLSN